MDRHRRPLRSFPVRPGDLTTVRIRPDTPFFQSPARTDNRVSITSFLCTDTARGIFERAAKQLDELRPEDLTGADEVFISSTGGGVIPITRVNDRPIGNGAPGLATCQLRDLYWEKRRNGWHATPIAGLLAEPAPSAAVAE